MSENKKIFATPKVRKFARELGANLSHIQGSARGGRITESDIKNFVNSTLTKKITNPENKNNFQNLEFNHSEFGNVEIKDIPRIKKIAAPNLSYSWKTIPHVTHHDEVDITELENFRNSLTDNLTGEKKKITPLVFIMKSLVLALKKFSNFNCSIDQIENGKMTLKKYFHIGIAVDTKHGLMVPKLRNADKKNLNELNLELKDISEKCRNLKIDKKEFYGGSITITSLGGIGGSFFTPIINYPEVAILGIGRTSSKQVLINDKFENRAMLPISLSYDHRIIDGAEAARFCNEIKNNLGSNFAYKLSI
tara:strand:+ start:216 stop:1136 length:921 start_codon:yes stop_codon:yes gene_type:complete